MIAARAYWRGVMTMLLFFVLSSLLSLVWEGVAFEAQVVVGGADMLVVLFLVYNHSMAMIMVQYRYQEEEVSITIHYAYARSRRLILCF